jgi:hypothetical protein
VPGFGAIDFLNAPGHGGDGVDLLLVFGSSEDRRENIYKIAFSLFGNNIVYQRCILITHAV